MHGPTPHPTRLLTTAELDHALYSSTKFEVAAIVDDVMLWSAAPLNPYLRPHLPGPHQKAFMANEPELISGDEHERWVKSQIKEYNRRLQRERLSPRKRHVRETDREIEKQTEELPTQQRNVRGAPRPRRYRDDGEQEVATPPASATTPFTHRITTGRLASRTAVLWTPEMRAALHLMWIEIADTATRVHVFNHIFRDQLPDHVPFSKMTSQEGTRRDASVSKRALWVPAMQIVDSEYGTGLLQEIKDAEADLNGNAEDDDQDEDEDEQD
ncbi:hypothetical protein LTR81_028182 [Elasticomyces elasticus]